MPRTIMIELTTVTDDQYNHIANAVWDLLDKLATSTTLGGGTPPQHWVRHDGDAVLAQELNQAWDQRGQNTRWN